MEETISSRVLFVEDVPTDAELAERALRAGGIGVASLRVETREAFLAALSAFAPDIVISDYAMPGFDGMAALRLARDKDALLPFIVLTGAMNEDTAVECMKGGASDYVIKEHMARLPFAVKDALGRRRMQALAMEASDRLKESEERYRSIFQASPAIMFIIDPEDGSFVEVNRAGIDFYGWSREEFLALKISQVNTMTGDQLRGAMAETISAGSRHFEARHRLANGDVRDVEIHSGPIVLGGRTLLFSIVHDISTRIAAERERDELSSRLNHYLATSPTVTYSLRIKNGEARWQWASGNIKSLLGYSVEEVLLPDWWRRNVHPADRMRAFGGITKLVGAESKGQEYRFLRKDKSEVWLRDEMHISEGGGGETEIVGTLTDISERKRIEADLSLKGAALEAAASAIVITDRGGKIQWMNPAFGRLTGYSREEAIGKDAGALIRSGRQDAAFYRELWDTILAGRVWRGQLVNKRKDGEQYTEEMTITPVLDDSRRVNCFIAIKDDVTEREESRQRLVASLAEKEELLREIHHRNHNTMQLIISLLHLSTREFEDPRLKEAIDGISMRLFSIAQVHEQFYGSEDMASIDFAEYLRRCTENLRAEHSGFHGSILVEMGVESVPLTLEKAIPAGLIVAELLTNALRYAYPEGSEQGNIVISLRKRKGEAELSVRDYGVGMPGAAAMEGVGSLGMTLIRILAGQLSGKAEFRSSKGTEVIVRFPAK
jgi:PAS domain S-box-containing protein